MIRKSIYLSVIFLLFMMFSCKKKDVLIPIKMKFAKIEFTKKIHDFGSIKQGDKVKTDFEFINSGDTDLLVTQAYGSCGCTIPEWPKSPIKKGGKGNIKVSFDSHGKSGVQDVSVTIIANTYTGLETLIIKAIVLPKTGVTH